MKRLCVLLTVVAASACTVSRPLTYDPAEAEAILRSQAEEAEARPEQNQRKPDAAQAAPLPLK